MSFNKKNPDIKNNNVPSGSVNHTWRKEFMEDLPSKTRNTVRGVDIALINEATSAISEKRATINGKAPGNRAERYIVMASYFKTARTNLHMFFEGASNVKHNYVVDIKYNDQSHIIKFPDDPLEN